MNSRRRNLKRLGKPFARIAAAITVAAACSDGTGNGPQPDYQLLLAPPALNVAQGATPAVAVTIDRTNFTGGVALFLSGMPSQVSGSFLPATTNTSSSTLTVTVGAGVTPGNYTLVVNGNGAPGARITNLPLTVTAAPNYTLELTPGTLTIARGSIDSTAITITRSNFTGPVTLGLDGAPAGVTSAFNPGAPTTNTSTLTITVGAGAAPGNYMLTVTGNATIGDRTAGLNLTVN